MNDPYLIAIDWGTTTLRAAVLDARGQVLKETRQKRGILSVAPGQFASVLVAATADFPWAEGTFCLISGMAGSQQGWREAPYCLCPATLNDLGQALTWIKPDRMAIVPGLRCDRHGAPDVVHRQSIPDVMRGEEVQIFGALNLLGLRDATVVLPGTHSKWATVRDNQVQHFFTCMTGEFYALLREHSILSRSLPKEDGPLDEAAFDRGVAHALVSGSLLASAFSTRTLALTKQLAQPALPSYLSGLVIGEELRTQSLSASDPPLVVVGAPALTQRYQRALASMGIQARCVGDEATWRGLFNVYQHVP